MEKMKGLFVGLWDFIAWTFGGGFLGAVIFDHLSVILACLFYLVMITTTIWLFVLKRRKIKNELKKKGT